VAPSWASVLSPEPEWATGGERLSRLGRGRASPSRRRMRRSTQMVGRRAHPALDAVLASLGPHDADLNAVVPGANLRQRQAGVATVVRGIGLDRGAIEAYRADRGTYVGLTLAKIRAYDKSVVVSPSSELRRTSTAFRARCAVRLSTTTALAAPFRRGPCGVRGAVVAQPQPKQTPPAPADAAATAQSRLRAAVPAIEAYAADNGGYAGLTLAKIHAWDYGVQVSVAWAKRSEYCIQSTVGTATYHLRGPAHPPAAGRCPAAT
jgi:hypothetical protein